MTAIEQRDDQPGLDDGRRTRPAWISVDTAGAGVQDLAELAHLRRARDLMERCYADPLDVPALARAARMSPSHFARRFRAAYGETPGPGCVRIGQDRRSRAVVSGPSLPTWA